VGRRTIKVVVALIAVLALFQNFGFNVTGLVAGLGLGGLAVALAAQETVKNFFGGVALIADQPVRVGDFCRFGDKMGTVEDISLWSTRVRTLERTVVSIPNGQFVGLQLENFTRRDRMWLHTTMGLHYETTPDQLRHVLGEIRALSPAKQRAGALRGLRRAVATHRDLRVYPDGKSQRVPGNPRGGLPADDGRGEHQRL
jgi:MscS family membrane protein